MLRNEMCSIDFLSVQDLYKKKARWESKGGQNNNHFKIEITISCDRNVCQ